MSRPTPEFIALQRAVAGRYSLDRELGRGGMGIVFLARDVALDRLVAVKLLPPELAASAERRERFLNEARMAAGLSHPHIVPIHSVEERHDLAFFVMGYVDGETLAARLRRDGRLSVEDATRMMQEVAWALGHAHARGIIHRDIKPDNILLERGTGRALVVDFGIGRAEQVPPVTDEVVIGTPRFMSPEQKAGAQVDARSDLYSLGLTAFVALTGQHPHDLAGFRVAAREPGAHPTVRTLRASVPTAVERVIQRCLAVNPDERFPTADELAESLRATRVHEATLSPPLRAWARNVDRAGGEMGSAGAAVAIALALSVAFGGEFLIPQVYMMIAVLLFAIGAARYGELVLRARALLAEGLGYEAASRALEIDQPPAHHEAPAPAHRRLSARTGATALLGAGKSGVLIWLVPRELPEVVSLLVIAGSVVVPAAFLRQLWADLFPESTVLSRLMRGGLGRFTFAAARVGQRELPALAPVTEPTMLTVGRGAEDLYRALPASQRERLAELPATVERLQAEAVRLRRGGDLAQLEQVMTVLEMLRLELLRLHAGVNDMGELTRALERARTIGHQIDRMASAAQEADGLVERTPA